MDCKRKMKKKTFKKKQNASWLSRYKPTALAVHRPSPGLGRSLFTKLKTEFFVNVTGAASGIFTGFLNPGSCFDPCGDLAAIQPVMFDQFALLYARYLVVGGTVDIEASTYLVGAGAPGAASGANIAIYPSTVSTALATYQGVASQPYSKTTTMIVGGPTKKLHLKFNTQQIVGSRLPVIAEDCGALVSASPATGQNVVVPIFIQYFQAAATTTMLRIRIIQDVVFDQKIQNVDA